MTAADLSIAGDHAACIRRATMTLQRAIILWGAHALTRTTFAHEAVGRIRRASARGTWAVRRAWDYYERTLGYGQAMPLVVRRAWADYNAVATRAGTYTKV